MGCFKILDQNWAFDETVDAIGSSENVDFPASNMNQFLRSQVWRSAGFFKITTSNNKLNFKDTSGGGELTATIPVANYQREELGDAIEAAMQAVSGFTYTVSFDEFTFKWSISTSGTYLDLLRNTGSNVAQSIFPTIGFGADADSTGDTEYVGAKVAIHTEEWLVLDLKVKSPVDYVAVIFSPLSSDGIKLSEDATIRLQASATTAFSTLDVDVALSIDPTYDVITHFLTSAVSHRYWRIKIVDPQNGYGYVELCKVLLGVRTEIQNPEIGFTYRLIDQSKTQKTPYGHPYADVLPSLRAFEFNYAAMSESDIDTLFQVYNRLGNVTPIAIDVDGAAEIWDKDKFFIYGRLNGDFQSQQRFLTYFDSSLRVEETL